MGGVNLARERCILAMRVTGKLTYDEYWQSHEFFDKRPVRNGSSRMMVGDNIYHHEAGITGWIQESSHHSNSDGTPDPSNIRRDTQSPYVLVSKYFYYFGASAPLVPQVHLARMEYASLPRDYRVFPLGEIEDFLSWLEKEFGHTRNQVVDDPIQFADCTNTYSAETDRVSRLRSR